MSTKKFAYHTSHSYVTNGIKVSMASQLYQIGVYVIIDDDPQQQFNVPPSKMVSIEKTLKQELDKGKITELEFGRQITVQKVDGFWKEV